jgi:DNA polymerase III subunit chi
MGEFRFHHLDRRRVDQALPALLEQAYGEGRRVVVRAPSQEMVEALNDRLWTYDDASFLPHGAAGDGDPMSQPVSLTAKVGNPNGATMLVLVSGAETCPDDATFDSVVRLFDGRDAEAIAEARREWRRLKDEGRTLSYWREGKDGWERAG